MLKAGGTYYDPQRMSSIPLISEPQALSALLEEKRRDGALIGFVPTMGALHDGHIRLAQEIRATVDVLVVSIFVNPTQFGPKEDFATYPRDLEGDRKKLEVAGIDVLFTPTRDAMYLPGDATRVNVSRLTEHLCGPFRPGHFEGVATVVAKFFAIVGRSHAAFGKKDFQQLAVLRRMAKDLFLPITIEAVPTVREEDGLAMSSRNAYLSAADRTRARAIPEALALVADAYEKGERDGETLEEVARMHLVPAVDRIDYVSVVDTLDLAPAKKIEDGKGVIALACHIGKTRLIDNFELGVDRTASLGASRAAGEK